MVADIEWVMSRPFASLRDAGRLSSLQRTPKWPVPFIVLLVEYQRGKAAPEIASRYGINQFGFSCWLADLGVRRSFAEYQRRRLLAKSARAQKIKAAKERKRLERIERTRLPKPPKPPPTLEQIAKRRSKRREYYYAHHEEMKARYREKSRARYWAKKSDAEYLALRRKQHRIWCEKNKQKKKDANRKWVQENKEKARKQSRAWRKKWRKTPYGRIVTNLRRRLRVLVKRGRAKKGRVNRLIGCSPIELVQHIEDHFSPGMSWTNYGQWHLDHIRPIASFDLLDDDEMNRCFHYTNLQPLWAEDNIAKGASVDHPPVTDSYKVCASFGNAPS
ncbi:MAG: hypothetical protein KGL39_60620, partial [Patescibacteria group bacterium]|nr:hypothetical protein [Patescibacteria group bacterium]